MLKTLSLFSGIGGYEKALCNLDIDFDLINYCEIDTKKSKAYSTLHNIPEDKNLIDVTNIDVRKIQDFDLLVYSPPCQSFSIAGNKKGLNDIRGTLFYDAYNIICKKQPKFCIMENVDNLPNKFKKDFDNMLNHLNKAGYNNYWKIINAKDFIPQNRNRVFVVSIRKDVDNKSFEFAHSNNTKDWSTYINPTETRELTGRQKKMIDYVILENKENIIKIEGVPQFEHATIMLRQSGLRFQNNAWFPTLCANMGKGGGNFPIIAYKGHIGGVTPRQCFKLMGFEYEDCDKLKNKGFSNSSLYVMAGDSVVVNVLEAIFKQMVKFGYLKTK